MKRNKSFTIILMLAYMLITMVSCDDDIDIHTPRKATLDILSEEVITTGPLGSRQEISLLSSYPWYAEASADWVEITKYRGQALKEDKVVFDLEENPNMDARKAVIQIKLMDQLTQEVEIVQNGRSTLITLLEKMAVFNSKGGEAIINIQTITEWKVAEITMEGITATQVDINHLKITATQNDSSGEKNGVIKLVAVDGSTDAEVEVKQLDIENVMIVSLPQEGKDCVVCKNTGEMDVPVTVNQDYEVISTADWITISDYPQYEGENVERYEFKISIGENPGIYERTGKVIIRSTSNPEIQDELILSQRGVSKIIYVKAGVSGGDGTSWERAFGSIADGMANCDNYGDMELWVAAGDYQLTETLNWKFINVYGGFDGTENKVKDRDLSKKARIIGGSFMTMNSWTNWGSNRVWMDGFEFTGARNEGSTYMGTLEIYGFHGFKNCLFRDNRYGKNAGGYYDKNNVFVNCVFADNHTEANAGCVQVKADCKFYNVTFVNNYSKSYCGGIRFGGSGIEVFNSVFWGNSHDAGTSNNIYLDSGAGVKLVNCAVESTLDFNHSTTNVNCRILNSDNAAGDGPGFVDPANGDYQLQSGSVLIDAGHNDPVGILDLKYDISGNPRICNEVVDLGAYEFFVN